MGIVLKNPIGKEKSSFAVDHGVELFAFGFAEAVFVVFAVNAFVVLLDDKGVSPGIMLKDEGLFFEFNAAGEEQDGKAGDEFLHNERTMRPAGATGKGENLR